MMNLTLLGTTSMMPTRHRSHSAHFLEIGKHGVLFDCGEGTQRQFLYAGLNRQKVNIICISHWHGDHVSGLLGMLQSVCREMAPESAPILLIGPPKSKEYYHHLSQSLAFESGFKVDVIEVPCGELVSCYRNEEFEIKASGLEHPIPTLAFSLRTHDRRNIDKNFLKEQGIPAGPHLKALKENRSILVDDREIHPEEATYIQKGLKFVYVADTRLCQNAITIADQADLLLCEATHIEENHAKAVKTFHLTAKQAAAIARDAEVGKLVMTHFSVRYPNSTQHLKEAKEIFDNSFAGKDFMNFMIK